jgi:hypothetical protein
MSVTSRLFPQFVGGLGAPGLLVLRLVAGAAMMSHGWPKIQHAISWMGQNVPRGRSYSLGILFGWGPDG